MATSEFELIARLAPYLADAGGDLAVGHGDDAAVLVVDGTGICVAVDVVVEGRHFLRGLSSPADVGWKALAVNVSDVAAMGGIPLAAVVGLCRPATMPAEDVEQTYAGMAEAAERWGVRLVGGDVVDADALIVAVTILGRVAPERAVTRAGARPGDALVVAGPLGMGAAGLALARRGASPDPGLLAAHRRPRALVAAGLALAEHGATAMIDVSDGLGADLGHVCAASDVRAVVQADALPIPEGVRQAATQLGVDLWTLACGGGEDFALAAAVPPDRAAAAAAAAAAAEKLPAAVAGRFEPYPGSGPAVVLELPDGERRSLDGLGYEHYRSQERSNP